MQSELHLCMQIYKNFVSWSLGVVSVQQSFSERLISDSVNSIGAFLDSCFSLIPFLSIFISLPGEFSRVLVKATYIHETVSSTNIHRITPTSDQTYPWFYRTAFSYWVRSLKIHGAAVYLQPPSSENTPSLHLTVGCHK